MFGIVLGSQIKIKTDGSYPYVVRCLTGKYFSRKLYITNQTRIAQLNLVLYAIFFKKTVYHQKRIAQLNIMVSD